MIIFLQKLIAIYEPEVIFPVGYYACGAEIKIALTEDVYYVNGLLFHVCNGTNWEDMQNITVSEVVSTVGETGNWTTNSLCPNGSFITAERVLIVEINGTEVFGSMNFLCDDQETWIVNFNEAG